MPKFHSIEVAELGQRRGLSNCRIHFNPPLAWVGGFPVLHTQQKTAASGRQREILVLCLISCVTLVKSLNFSEPWFPQLYLYDKYLRSACYVLPPALGAGNIVVDRQLRSSLSIEGTDNEQAHRQMGGK